MRTLELILKSSHACNNNCSYCYYFGQNDRNFQNKDKFMLSYETAKKIAAFLKQGCLQLNIDKLIIIFHGGEPLLQNTKDFSKNCDLFKNTLEPITELELGIQTNGVLISDEWIKVFEKYNLSPSVSLDGLKKDHDLHRKDHDGKGTHDRVVQGIKTVQKAGENNPTLLLGILSVLNPQFSASKIYNYFTRELNIKKMDFLFPDFNHDTFIQHLESTGLTVHSYAEFINELFDLWTKDDNPKIDIRFLKSIMLLLSRGYSCMDGIGPPIENDLPLFTIDYDGALSVDDVYTSTNCEEILNLNVNVDNIDLKSFLNLDAFKKITKARSCLPKYCSDSECPWANICCGGVLVHRFSKENYFDNPTVYCEGLKSVYKHVATYMLNHGLSEDVMYQNLFPEKS